MAESQDLAQKLALVRGILEGAFFSPLSKGDLLAFKFGLSGLLSLEEDELFDLFVRSAMVAETVHPESAPGRTPLAWVMGLKETAPVMAQVMASLVSDRPLLFHRVLYALPAVVRQELNPDDFELMEDFLQKALEQGGGLGEAAREEAATVAARAFRAAGAEGGAAGSLASEKAAEILTAPEIAGFTTDAELVMWLAMGGGLDGVPRELGPETLVEVWRRWSSAVLGETFDLALTAALYPALSLSTEELGLHAPPGPDETHLVSAQCPFCGQLSSIQVTPKPRKVAGCDHLAYVGTTDEVHLLEVVERFDLGEDFKALLASYYDSPADHHLFSTIINDLFEMLSQQGRLHMSPLDCRTAPRAFYNLRAFFAGPRPEREKTH